MGKARFILPNIFTSLNFLLGAFSICWTTGAFSTSDPILMGAYFVILCVLLDKLDGFAARLVNASSEFGAQFDSLADLIAFGLAPAFCIVFAYKNLAPSFFEANTALMAVSSPDTVTVGDVQLPVSRKYKETVHEYASERNDG